MTATSTAASTLPPVRTSCHVPLSLMTSISEETIALWLKLGALEKLEQAVLDGYGDQLCGKTSRIPQVNKFLKQVPLFQNKIREIHQAVSQGRLRDVQHLIDRKKLAFCRDHNGASPLHKAVIFGHQDVIEYLVKRYAGSIHIRDHQGRTALHYAAFLPDRGEIYQYLLANGADERAMDVYGRQPSYYLDGQNESTLRQLRDGSTLNGLRKIKPRYYGQVTSGQPFTNSNRPTLTKSQIRELISEGNLSELEDLVLQGQGDRLLGETSTLPKIQSFLNIVPMYMERIYDVHRAVMRDQLEHVVILLENKKLALGRDQLGATPLHKAVLFGHYKIAHFISHQFTDTLNAIDMEGRTALHYAAVLKDNKNMYGVLTEAGANKGITDNKGKTADYYAQYPEHLNLDEVIKRCHKVNANYLANTANRIKGKSPVRQTPPPSNGNLSSPRSEENNSSNKIPVDGVVDPSIQEKDLIETNACPQASNLDTSQSNDSGNENELISLLQKDKIPKRLDMSSANIRRWVNAKDMDKLTKAVMEGYGEKVVRVNTNEESEDKEQINGKISEMVERINAIHSAVSSDDLTELQNHLEERDFALAKDHLGNTPLHKSVLLRKSDIVDYLIEKFPETINAKNKNGLTALHYAAAMSRKNGLQLYKTLLQAGADPKIRDNHGRTPDYYKTHLITLPNKGMMRTRPIGGRHSETLNRYSKQGVLERMTAALQRGDVELLQDLVLEGHGKHLFGKTSWNDDVKTFLKELPSYLNKIKSLHESTQAGDVEKLKELVTSNEKLMRARDETGSLPMHIAAASENSEVLQYFVKNFPSSLNVKDGTGKTALHIVSQKGNAELCKMLKQAGADTKILDQKGKTADFYLQTSKQDGTKIENDSSKSSVNSSSESSYSTINIDRSRRRRPNKPRKQMLQKRTAHNVTKASVNTIKTENLSKRTKAEKQNDAEAPESIERKESLSKEESKDAKEVEESEPEKDDKTEDFAEENDIEVIKENQEEHNIEEETVNAVTETETDADHENAEVNDADKSEDESEIPSTSNEDDDTVIEMDLDKQTDESKTEQSTNESKEEKDTANENGEEGAEKYTEEEAEENTEKEAEENTEKETEENTGKDAEENDEAKAEDDGEETLKENETEFEQSKDYDTAEENEENNEDNAIQNTDDGDNNDDVKEEPSEKEDSEEVSIAGNDNANTEKDEENEENTDYMQNETGQDDEDKNENEADIDPEVQDAGGTADENKEENESNEDQIDAINTEGDDPENTKIENSVEGVTVAEVGSRKKESIDNTESNHEEENENDSKYENHETTEDNLEDDQNCDDSEENKVGEDDIEENNSETDEKAIENMQNEVDNENAARETENDVNNYEDNKEEENADNIALIEENDNPVDKEDEEQKELDSEDQKEETLEDPENDEIKLDTEDHIENDNDSKMNTQDEPPHQTKDHLDELIEHWIKEGDLLRLEHVVLAGQGDRLIERMSEDKQVQDFLDLVPIYMAKIRAVHEAVAKGQLREVRSVLTRKRFALSRDHVGASPLHLAVLYGHTDVSTYIISHFPETMDGPDNEGRTPLHYATASPDNGGLYRLLKAAGADENIEDKAGHSPKYYMSCPGSLTLEQLLEPYSSSE